LRKKVWKNLNEIEKLPGARCRNQNRKFLHRKWRPERGSEGTERKHSSLSEAVKREAIALENRYGLKRMDRYEELTRMVFLASSFLLNGALSYSSVGATVGSFLNVIIFPSASDLGVPWRVV
jgi:hypothetical protein